MKFPKTAKVEKILSKDPAHPILHAPYLHEREDGSKVVLASNKVAVAIIPVTEADDDTTGTLHIEAVKAARKGNGVIRCEQAYCIAEGEVAYPRSENFTSFPDVESLLLSKADTVFEVALNAKILADLASSMGCEVVKIRISSADLPLTILPHGSETHIEGSKGVLMPYRTARSV